MFATIIKYLWDGLLAFIVLTLFLVFFGHYIGALIYHFNLGLFFMMGRVFEGTTIRYVMIWSICIILYYFFKKIK